MQDNDCVDTTVELRADDTGQLPFEANQARIELVRRHTLPVVLEFCQKRETLLKENELMLWLGETPELQDARYRLEHTSLVKSVIYIGSHAYCFLNNDDKKHVWQMSRDNQQLVWDRFGKAMLRIVQQQQQRHHRRRMAINSSDSEPDEMDDKPLRRVKREPSSDALVSYQQKRPRLDRLELARRDEQCTALSVELALVKQENQNQVERYRLETALMQSQHELALKSKDNEVLTAQLALTQQQQYFTQLYQQFPPSSMRSPLALGGGPVPRKVTTVQEWLKDSHYQQDLSQIPLPKEVRYHNVFNDQRVRYTDLLQALQVLPISQNRLLLAVPLTYRYKLSDILHSLVQSQQGSAYKHDFTQLMRCCPPSYTILLHWVNLKDGVEVAAQSLHNWLNVSVILVHCQAIALAYDLNRPAKDLGKQVKASSSTSGKKAGEEKPVVKEKELLQVQVIVPHQNELVPSLGPLDDFYPYCAFYGAGTFITPSLGLRLCNPTFKKDKNKKIGTGNGKLCPLCWTMDRVYTLTATEAQHTHSICSCPQLAMLSDNEAQVLLAIRHAATSWRGNEERASKLRQKKFLFGKSFSLGEKALFRHATAEELALGEHVAGLRVNTVRYLEMRQTVFTLLKVQMKRSPLLGPLHRRLDFLAQLLLTQPGLDHTSSIAQLLIDTDGNRFSLKPRSFDIKDGQQDRLYFSLKSPVMTPREASYYQDCQVQVQTQLYYAQSLYQQQNHYQPPPSSDFETNDVDECQ